MMAMPQTAPEASTIDAPERSGAAASVTALELEHITCSFVPRTPGAQRYTAIDDTTLTVRDSEFVVMR